MEAFDQCNRRPSRPVLASNRQRSIRIPQFLIVVAVLLLPVSSAVLAQSRNPSGQFIPPPDPGYTLYYHDSDSAPSFSMRWGYHDGWEDGRRDRNHGDEFHAQDKDRYTSPPEHGGHLGITRSAFVKAYREAYAHGYEHGSRL
jgi:hypothetical protein